MSLGDVVSALSHEDGVLRPVVLRSRLRDRLLHKPRPVLIAHR